MYKTNFDKFKELRAEYSPSDRHYFEGLAVIVGPLNLINSRSQINNRDVFGLNVGREIFDILENHEKYITEEGLLLLEKNLVSPEYVDHANARNFHDLIVGSTRLAKKLENTEFDRSVLQDLGEKLDSNFDRFYNRKGLETNPEKRNEKNHRFALRSEAFYFGINSRDAYKVIGR